MANINLLQLPHQTYLLGPKHCGSWNCLRFQLGLSLTYSLLNKSNPSWMSVSQEVCVCVCVCVCVHARVRACTFFATPWAAACQAPLSVEFSRQEYWRGLPFLLPRGLADPGIEPVSPESSALTGEFFTTVSSGRPCKSGLVDILDT